MDHIDHDRSGIALGALQGRIRELSSQLAHRLRVALPKPSTLRKLKAIAFIILAILFGTVAFRLNREETVLQWRRSHLPSASIWTQSFAALGFRGVTNPSWAARVTRSLPSAADVTGQIWKASPDWWAIDTTDGSQPLVFCLRCAMKPLPTEWIPAGDGWEGWESVMKTAKDEARTLLSSGPTNKRREGLDPREIRY